MAHDYATRNGGLAGVEESRFFLSSDSLARTENGQLVPRNIMARAVTRRGRHAELLSNLKPRVWRSGPPFHHVAKECGGVECVRPSQTQCSTYECGLIRRVFLSNGEFKFLSDPTMCF